MFGQMQALPMSKIDARIGPGPKLQCAELCSESENQFARPSWANRLVKLVRDRTLVQSLNYIFIKLEACIYARMICAELPKTSEFRLSPSTSPDLTTGLLVVPCRCQATYMGCRGWTESTKWTARDVGLGREHKVDHTGGKGSAERS